MKTQTTFIQNNILKSVISSVVLLILLLASNQMNAQTKTTSQSEVQKKERTVKGVVKDDVGPLEGVTIYLKDTNVAVSTDENGAFTFPQKLKENDQLVVTQLGYKNKQVTIRPETSFVEITMNDYDIIIVGSLMIGNNSTNNQNNK
jgi:hypothetical protein